MSMGFLLWRIRVRDQRRESRLSEVKSVESWRGGMAAVLGESDGSAGHGVVMVFFRRDCCVWRSFSRELSQWKWEVSWSARGDLVVEPI